MQWRVDGLSGDVMPLRFGPWSGEVRWGGGDAVEVYLIRGVVQRRGGLVVMIQWRGGTAER